MNSRISRKEWTVFLVGRSGAGLAQAVAFVVWPVVLLSLTHNVAYVGYYWAVRGVAQLAIAPILGWLIDRLGTRWFFAAFDIMGFAVTLAMSEASAPVLLGLSVVLQAVEYAQSLAPQVAVGLQDTDEAARFRRNAILSTVGSALSVVGPMVAFALMTHSVRLGSYAILVGYVITLVSDVSTQYTRQVPDDRGTQTFTQVHGAIKLLAPYLAIFAALAFIGREVDVVGIVQATQLWPMWANGLGLGILEAAISAGCLVAGLMLSLSKTVPRETTVYFALLAVAATAAGVIFRNISVSILGLIAAGASATVANVGITTQIQMVADSAVLGRAFAAMSLIGNIGGSAVGVGMAWVTQAAGRVIASIAVSAVGFALVLSGGLRVFAQLRSARAPSASSGESSAEEGR